MGLLTGIKNVFIEEENELEFDEDEMTRITRYEQKGSALPKNNVKMVLYEPRTYEEGQVAGISLKERKACVINLHRLDEAASQRVIDFLAGVVFILNGSIQKIGVNIILCTPANVEVSNTTKEKQ